MSKDFCEKASKRMKINNPMFDSKVIEKVKETMQNKFRDKNYIHHRLGKYHTKETKEKLSLLKQGTTLSEITKNKIREAQKRINENKELLSNEDQKLRVIAQRKAFRNTQLKSSCEICNSTDNLQRHHWRYDKPLLVNTLCRDCHDIQHIKNFYGSKFGGF